jgi:hypothetical protein
MRWMISMLGCALVVAGCGRPRNAMMVDPSELRSMEDGFARVAAPDAPLAESLFKEDQAVLSNEDLQKILAARVVVPDKAKLAVVRFGRLPYWWGWSEEFVRVNDQIDADFLGKLRTSARLKEVAYLPSLVTPNLMTLPYLRQAAARCQADLLLVYRTSTRTYTKQRWFKADQTKAYCTVEAVILDTRTGLLPFSTVANEFYSAGRTRKEMDFAETIAKAEQRAIGRAWVRVAEDAVSHLDGIAPGERAGL